MAENGYDSEERLLMWQRMLAEAAARSAGTVDQMDQLLRRTLGQAYERLVVKDGLMRLHPGVSRFTLERLKPQLRAQLDRAILASAELIRLNKAEAVRKTLQRFSGWATSIPPGGAAEHSQRETKKDIKKSLAQLPFAERRVLIDQGHKLTSNINRIVATEGGAVAAEWRSHFAQPGYDYRPDHKARHGKVYLVRGSWAQAKGLVRPGPAGYTDQVTQPAEEPFCRCAYTYLYNLRQLPDDMLTERGREVLADARARAMEAAA